MVVVRSMMCLISSLSTGQVVALVNANANANAEQQQAWLMSRQQSLEAAWSTELDEERPVKKRYVSPVKRVTNLLIKMKTELEAEADKESEMYDKMVCWCESNEKEKSQAVTSAEARDDQLGSEVEGRSARVGELNSKIGSTKKDLASNKDALARATAIREEEAAKFSAEEKDMMQSVTNLRNAIEVLSKHQTGGSLLQLGGSVLAGVRVLLRNVALKYEEMMVGRAERQRFEPGSQHVSLVSLMAVAKQAKGDDAEVSKFLSSALNVDDRSISGMLPLKFAEKMVAKEAGRGDSENKFLQVSGGQPLYKSYSSRSNQIYGILRQMQEEFEAELSSAQKAEMKAQESFSAVAAAKAAEIEATEKTLDEMEVDAASNQKALADAREDLTLTREQRSVDVEFLKNLKLTCNDLDAQWEKRSQTRAAETQAVAEAIAVLTEDDNRETTARSVALIQERSTVDAAADAKARRSSAAAVLHRAAEAPGFDTDDLLEAWRGRGLGAGAKPRAQLSTLAVAVQLDSFKKVKAMIDKMLLDLKDQQEEEVALKKHCTSELNTNEKTMYDKSVLQKDLVANIDRLDKVVQQLTDEIAEAKKQMAEASTEIKKASQTREVENTEFQRIVGDQRATQTILRKALMKLKDFYEKKIGQVVFAQRSKQTPPVKFNSYKTNSGASPVIGLLEQIIGDSERLEAEASASEHESQAAYENFVMDSNTMIKGLQEATTSKTKAIASSKREQAEANSDLESTESEMESLAEYKADLHNQCDFVMKNFDIRQKARLEEMEAIKSAKAILAGMQ